MSRLKRFFTKDHGFGKLVVLFLEEYASVILRGFPGLEGMWLRWLFAKLTFKRMGRFSLIYREVILTHTYALECGDNVSMYYGSVIDARGGLTIGNNSMIGPKCMVMTFDHDHTRPGEPMNHLSPIYKPVVIGSNVWIGGNCSILGGVTIGDNAIVAAGAVVTKDVEPGTVVGGVPAKLIRAR